MIKLKEQFILAHSPAMWYD